MAHDVGSAAWCRGSMLPAKGGGERSIRSAAIMGCSQAVRHRTLTPIYGGPTPPTPVAMRGSVWQSAAFGMQKSQVQILPHRLVAFEMWRYLDENVTRQEEKGD